MKMLKQMSLLATIFAVNQWVIFFIRPPPTADRGPPRFVFLFFIFHFTFF